MSYQDPFNPLPRDWERDERMQEPAFRGGRSYAGLAALAAIIGLVIIVMAVA